MFINSTPCGNVKVIHLGILLFFYFLIVSSSIIKTTEYQIQKTFHSIAGTSVYLEE